MHTSILLLFNLGALFLSSVFLIDCIREQEPRASRVAALLVLFFLTLITLILWTPSLRFIADIVVGLTS